jgi:hypothetical protein
MRLVQNKIQHHVVIKCWVLHLRPLLELHSESQNDAGSDPQLTSLWPFIVIENWFFNKRNWKIYEEKQQYLTRKGTVPEHYQESEGSPFLWIALRHPCLSFGSKISEDKTSSETHGIKKVWNELSKDLDPSDEQETSTNIPHNTPSPNMNKKPAHRKSSTKQFQ